MKSNLKTRIINGFESSKLQEPTDKSLSEENASFGLETNGKVN